MTTNFPTSLDSTSVLENDKTDGSLRAGNLADFQNNAADAILALEAKVGADSSAVTTSHDYKIRNLATNILEINGVQYAQSLTGLQAAHDALTSGGVIHIPPGADITCASAWTITNHDITIRNDGILRLPADSTSMTLIAASGTLSGTTHALTADGAEGALTITMSTTNSANYAAGDLIRIVDAQTEPRRQKNRVRSVNTGTGVLTLVDPLVCAFTTANTSVVAKVTPIRNFHYEGAGRLEGNGNTGASSRGLVITNSMTAQVGEIRANGFPKAALKLERAYGARVVRAFVEKSGDANESDCSFYECYQSVFENIVSNQATGFGPQWAWSGHLGIGNVVSSGASGTSAGRQIKFHGVRYFAAGVLVGGGSASTYTGVSFTEDTRHGTVSSITANGNGAAGVAFFDTASGCATGDINVGQVVTRNNTTRDLEFGSTTDTITILNANFGTMLDQGTGNIVAQTMPLDRPAGASLNNSTTTTDWYTRSVPASQLGTSRQLRHHQFGYITNQSGSNRTITWAVKFGASTLISDATINIPTGGSYSYDLEVRLQNRNDTQAQVANLRLIISAIDAATGIGDLGAAPTIVGSAVGSSAEDSTAAKTFAVTMTMSNNDFYIERYAGTVEII